MARSEQLKLQCIAAFHCHAFKKKTILENSPFFKSKITDTFENINISFWGYSFHKTFYWHFQYILNCMIDVPITHQSRQYMEASLLPKRWLRVGYLHSAEVELPHVQNNVLLWNTCYFITREFSNASFICNSKLLKLLMLFHLFYTYGATIIWGYKILYSTIKYRSVNNGIVIKIFLFAICTYIIFKLYVNPIEKKIEKSNKNVAIKFNKSFCNCFWKCLGYILLWFAIGIPKDTLHM